MHLKDKKKNFVKAFKEKQEGQKEKSVLSNYQIDQEIGNGVSSKVFSAININTGERVAIKKIKNFLENKHQSVRILRQILLLRQLKHPNIVNLKEVIIEGGDPKNLSLVLEYFPTDVKKLFKSNAILTYENIKRIIYQILIGLHYCQQCQVLHRDLKPENVLITHDYSQVKLCDFGLARAVYLEIDKEEVEETKNQGTSMKIEEEKPKHPNQHMPATVNLTAHVSTRWYRAPELIILERKYSNAIDMWSVGCILGELISMAGGQFTDRKPLFPGKACYPLSPPKAGDPGYKKINEFPHWVHDQLSVIFGIIGTPDNINFISDQRAKNYILSFGHRARIPFNQIFKNITTEAEDFLLHSLEFNPNKRMTLKQALNHPLFADIRQDYASNLQIEGSPINMELEGIQIPQIREMVMEQYKNYQLKQ